MPKEKFKISSLIFDVWQLNNARRNLQAGKKLTKADFCELFSLIQKTPEPEYYVPVLEELCKHIETRKHQFSKYDRNILLDILKLYEGELYPSQKTINRHEYHLSQIAKLSPSQDRNQYEMIVNQIVEFKNKYCK